MLPRLIGIDRGRQRLVVDLDRGGGILRLHLAFGDDRRDRLADVADLAARQRLDARHRNRRALLVEDLVLRTVTRTFVGLDRVLVRQHAGQVFRRDHGHDTRHRQRLRCIDTGDRRVGMRAAHDRDVDHAR